MSAAALDRRLLVLARTCGHTPARERAVAAVSRAGEHAAGWLAFGLAGAVGAGPGPRRAEWLRGARAVAVAYGANTALKLVVRRPRPSLPGLPALTRTPTGLSFPSAHATTGFAAARRYRRLAPDLAPALYGAAAALGLSRLYLGVHYPSDVIAGALLGTALGGSRHGGAPCR